MSLKRNNNLIQVIDSNDNIHYYTSLQKFADTIGTWRTTAELCMKNNKEYKHKATGVSYRFKIVDGGDVLYKNIN